MIMISMMTIASVAFAADATAPQGAVGGLGMFLPMILIFVIFYFLLIRPQKKQAKERQAMIDTLKKGDRVLLTSGLYGKVAAVADQLLTIEIADNVKVKAVRSAVQSVVPEQTALLGEGNK